MCVCVCVCVDQVRTEEVSLNSSMLELQFAGEDLDKKVVVTRNIWVWSWVWSRTRDCS